MNGTTWKSAPPRNILMSEFVTYNHAGPAAFVTLNRADKRNALNHTLRGDVLAALYEGDADPYVLADPVTRTQHYAPHGRFVSIAGAGHFAHEESPALVNDHLMRFLGQLG